MTKHDIIIIGADPWEHYTWRRRHHVAWNLAKNHRVLFVEPPLTIFQPFRDIDLSWRHLFNLGKLKHQGRNLYSYSPVRWLPLSIPGSKRFDYYGRDKRRIFRALKKIVNRLSFQNPVLWVYFNMYQYDYYGLFDEKIVVTDWYDDFSAPSGCEQSRELVQSIRKREDLLLEKSNIVFAASKELFEKLSKRRNEVYLITHGVEFDNYYNSARKSSSALMRKLESLKKPVLCFIGTMQAKIDFELLKYVSSRHRDGSLLLIGRRWFNNKDDENVFDGLIREDNVTYLDEIQNQSIPFCLDYVDVCLIPFKKMTINYVTSAPLKLLEYFASGKPVVATDLGRSYEFNQLVRVADSQEGFVSQIACALRENNDEGLILKRRKIAEDNSWLKRSQEMMEVIENSINS